MISRPTPTALTYNFRYYAIFIEDFSRFTWLYPLKRNQISMGGF